MFSTTNYHVRVLYVVFNWLLVGDDNPSFRGKFEVFMFHTENQGGGANSKKVNIHPKIPEIDLDFFLTFIDF